MCEPIFPKDGHMFEKLPGGTSSYLDPQRGIRGCLNAELTTQTATDTSLGVKVGAGASWQLFEHVAVFGEYRFTHFRAEPVLNSALSSLRVPLQSDLNTHHLLAGISWRF